MDSGTVSLLVAFGAGILSFLSPCVLPLVPIYVGYMAGSSVESGAVTRRLYTMVNSLAFGLGFSSVFVGFWASIGFIGFVLPGMVDLFRQAGGVVLIVLGVHQMGLVKIPLLYREARYNVQLTSSTTPVASFLVGVAFAAGWTPCIGPILAGIIGLASISETAATGALLLSAYCLGLGVPFLATAIAVSQAAALLKRARRYVVAVTLISGVMLVAIGLLMLSDSFKMLPQYFNWGAP